MRGFNLLRKIMLTGLFCILMLPTFALEDDPDSLLTVLRNTHLPSDRIVLLNRLAKAYSANDPIRSGNYASQALLIAESIEDEFGMAEAHYNLGILAYEEQRFSQSFIHFQKAAEGFSSLGDEKWLAKANIYLSRHYKKSYEYEKALQLLFKSMETFREQGKNKKLAETYNAIGGNYYDQGNYDKAYEFYENSLDIYRELNDERGMGSLYNNMGEIYRLNGDHLKAIGFYLKAYEIFNDYNLVGNLATLYNNLGSVYLEMDRLDSSEYYLNRGLELSSLIEDPTQLSSLMITKGKYYRALGDPNNALNFIKEGYDLSVRNGYTGNIIAASEALSDIYLEKSEFDKAYSYFAQCRNYRDSLSKQSNLEKITQLEMNLIFDLENRIQEEEIQRANLKYFTIGIVLVSLIVLVILLYSRQRIKTNQTRIRAENLQMERDRLQEEIDYKNRELATNVMYLVKKNELINFITEKLLKAKTNFKPAIRKTVDEILLDLQSNTNENIWKVFEERFQEVHVNFYDNLMKRFPRLTDNDRKLCAFLRLNMNTKEIAAITHQNPSSIEVARTRLRKKLNISNKDISLTSFLSNL